MKKIEAIVRPQKLDDLQEALADAGVNGMTISQVHGYGTQRGFKEYYRGSEVIVKMLPKIKVEIVVPNDDCQRIVDLISDSAYTGEVGDGKIFILPVDEVIRVRTRARGMDAIN